MNLLVFDIETIPDVDSGRRLYSLKDLSEKETAEVMFSQRRQDSDGATDFLRLHLHRVIAISVLLRNSDKLQLWTLGSLESGEAELIQRFFEGIERYTPKLISWNGRGFDLPVLHYRALLHGVQAPRYWELGNEDQSFRWNNYINRFHERHTDLMDLIAGYEMRAVAPLDQVATMLGFPGKMGMRGDKVWDRYLAGDIEAIRDYCETDVLNTYLVYLRFDLMRGQLTRDEYERECERVRHMLDAEDKPHLREFLSAWHEDSEA